jgi:sugar phosphate isomerase/epimerase
MTKEQLDRMIRIGTMAGKGEHTLDYIKALIPLGFESFQVNFWRTLGGVDLARMAAQLRPVLEKSGTVVSSLAVFGNPLGTDEADRETLAGWESAIDHASDFGCKLVCGFTGRVRGVPVPDSVPRLKEVWTPLLERAQARGVRIAFENCPMGGDWKTGDWNIAFNPDAWEVLFAALPFPNVGLEWEPCHQLCQLIEPIPQLRQWITKVFHVHGKDASVYRDILGSRGIAGKQEFAQHRHPGFGDTDWTAILSILRAGGYQGTIDIEGWHDPVYRDDLEMTGQVHALKYLQQCRGGDFVPNPTVG